MIKHRLKLGILASRNGSSFRAIVAAIAAGQLAAEVRLLVANTGAAGALGFARTRGLSTSVIPTQADPEGADLRLSEALAEAEVELVILSGYLRRIGPQTQARFPRRILNIHPGPLPRFGGEGMYGRRVHQTVIASGVAESAVTIHLVEGDYDRGPVLSRWTVPIDPGETAESLEARVTALEPKLFVLTLQEIAAGDLILPP